MRNRWKTMNGIFVKGQVTRLLDDGKTKEEIVDLFFSMNGSFLWGTSSKESIVKAVDEIIEINNKEKDSKNQGFFFLNYLIGYKQ